MTVCLAGAQLETLEAAGVEEQAHEGCVRVLAVVEAPADAGAAELQQKDLILSGGAKGDVCTWELS